MSPSTALGHLGLMMGFLALIVATTFGGGGGFLYALPIWLAGVTFVVGGWFEVGRATSPGT